MKKSTLADVINETSKLIKNEDYYIRMYSKEYSLKIYFIVTIDITM